MSHDCDGEYPDVSRTEKRRARVLHVCSACKEDIRVGDEYTYVFVVWEGAPYITRRCLRCEAIFQHLALKCRAEGGERWPASALDCGEDYLENWGEEPPPEIAALAFTTGHEMQVKR